MRKGTQLYRVYQYLKQHEVCTTNEMRNILRVVDIPKCISVLRRTYHKDIHVRHLPDHQAEYRLTRPPEVKWEFRNGVAYQI